MMHNRNMGTHTLNNHDLEDEIKIEFDFFFSQSFKNVYTGKIFLYMSGSPLSLFFKL